MGTHGDSVEITASATPTAESAAGVIKVPAGAKIIEVQQFNLLATGAVYAVRFDFPGMVTPQVYAFNITGALEGTEVGSGVIGTTPTKVDIDIPAAVSEVKLYIRAAVASQTATIFIKWVS